MTLVDRASGCNLILKEHCVKIKYPILLEEGFKIQNSKLIHFLGNYIKLKIMVDIFKS